MDLEKEVPESYTPEDLETIRSRLSNAVYAACGLLELHEQYHGRGKGCLGGNGHHAMQKAAQTVCNQFVERLIPPYRAWYEGDNWGGYHLTKEAKELTGGKHGNQEGPGASSS